MIARVAVIGCGYWGSNYLRIFDTLEGSRVEVACDLDPARLAAGTHAPRRTTSDWRVAVHDRDVDAVIVATPASTHHLIARTALDAGKHVLVEKPQTTRREDSADLLRLAASRRSVLMVGHTFLFNPGILALRDLLPRLGALRYLHATRTHDGPVRADVSVLWDLGPHDVAIFNALADATPTHVSAVGVRCLASAKEDVVFGTLQYREGLVANLHLSWMNPRRSRAIVAVGANGSAIFRDVRRQPQLRFRPRGGRLHRVDLPPDEPLVAQCRHFLEGIRGAPLDRCDGHEGLRVVAVLQALERSIRHRGQRVAVELEA